MNGATRGPRRRPGSGTIDSAPSRPVTIRRAVEADRQELERLCALDEVRLPAEPILVAEVDGVPEAALALESGQVVANPFAPSAGLVRLLEVYAEERPVPRARSGLVRRLSWAS